MSMAVVLESARDLLRSIFSDKECHVQPDGQPPPGCGQRFVSIHPTYWGPGEGIVDAYPSMHEEYRFSVTVSRRTPNYPLAGERRDVYLDHLSGLENICRAIIATLHQDPSFVDLMNTKLTALDVELAATVPSSLPGGYVQQKFLSMPIWLGGDSMPIARDGLWFFHKEPTEDVGASMEVKFGGVYRPFHKDFYVAFAPTVPSP